MNKSIFKNSFELKINGKVIVFNSPENFEFMLATRSLIPIDRIEAMTKATLDDLQLEFNLIIVAIEMIDELLGELTEKSGNFNLRLQDLNSSVFSRDNDWRDIFIALKQYDADDTDIQYMRVALEKYMEYLLNRKGFIDLLLKEYNFNGDSNAIAPSLRTGELEIDKNFDSNVLGRKLGATRIHKNQTVQINLKEGEKINLLLAKYKCKLVSKNGIKFIDHDGVEYPVGIGVTTVGRNNECSIRFPDSMSKISRLHLMIINHDNQKLDLIDLSTYGTHYLKSDRILV